MSSLLLDFVKDSTNRSALPTAQLIIFTPATSKSLLKQGEILEFLKRYTTSDNHARIENEFYDFREQQNQFCPIKATWENTDDAKIFWQKMVRLKSYFYLS